jgi:hypothetical protein
LVPNTPSALALEQHVELRHRLHHLDAIGFVFQALVDLDEGNDAALDQRLRHGLAARLPVHRALEQDRAQSPSRR